MLSQCAMKNFITVQRISLQSEQMKLGTMVRDIQTRLGGLETPLPPPSPYARDSNGQVIIQNNAPVMLTPAEMDLINQQYMAAQQNKAFNDQMIKQQLSPLEAKIQVRLTTIQTTLSGLDEQEKVIEKQTEAAVKRVFGNA